MPIRLTRATLPAALFMAAVLFMGGASRADVYSLVVLRPLAICVLGAATVMGPWWRNPTIRPTLYLVLATGILALIQLIPLPPAVWQSLPGRSLLVEIATVADIEARWRPLSMVPSGTWNALASLSVPLAMVALAGLMDRPSIASLGTVLLAAIVASALFGGLQLLGPDRSPLYLYKITNFGSAVGFFSNRNHQALLLAIGFPLLAVLACGRRSLVRELTCLALTVLFLVSIIITGSRTGAVLGLVGIMGGFAILWRGNDGFRLWIVRRAAWVAPATLALAGGIGYLAFQLSRATTLGRLVSDSAAEDLRFKFWPEIVELIFKYFPVGTGLGSFVEVYKVAEPADLVTPKYLNHAHNDWLEVALTGGLSGVLILSGAVAFWIVGTWRAWSGGRDKAELANVARCASIVLFMLAIHSVVDYPARTPMIMVVTVLAGCWLGAWGRTADRRNSSPDANNEAKKK